MAASVLTNSAAMVALQTLRTTNSNLESVNNQISTGKKVATAKDSAAVFAISKVMESDVAGFKAISESLSLGGATASVSSNAANQMNELLNEIKGKIVSANEENVDRTKLQDELVSLRNQVSSIVGAAQFNGLNLLNNSESTGNGTTAMTAAEISSVQGTGTTSVLSSLDRASNGTVSTASIDVAKQDLRIAAGTFNTGNAADVTAASGAITGTGTINDGASGTAYTISGNGGATGNRSGVAVLAGDGYQLAMSRFGGTGNVTYVAGDGDTVNDIASALVDRINFQLAAQEITGFTVTSDGADVVVENNSGANITTAAADVTTGSGGTASGGLELLTSIDVSTEAGAAAGLAAIEGLIQTTIDAQAAFGTSQKRIDLQSDFMSNLIDSFKSGIGALVDADLEEASARLQALQVQQQLGIQALSIANQAPQNILALFR